MPHEVIMPALGMAQDTGRIVAWHKAPGDPVAADDVLFEVETDKATMEVEAGFDGFVAALLAEAGEDAPVGDTIAVISAEKPENPERQSFAAKPAGAPAPAPEPGGAAEATAAVDPAPSAAVPDGNSVIMPALGMAQDTGRIVAWHKAPGDAVAADDVLFEVETDKATMEVEAGFDGFVAALLAEAGEDAPVGDTIAVISAQKPENPVQRSLAAKPAGAPAPAPEPVDEPVDAPVRAPDAKAATKPAAKAAPAAATPPKRASAFTGKVLASPKARRLALEQGLDLTRLAAQGHPMPYHVADLDTLRGLPDPAVAAAGGGAAHLTAQVAAEGFAAFIDFLDDAAAPETVWAAFAGASLRAATGAEALVVRVDQPVIGTAAFYADPDRGPLSGAEPTEETAPDLILRDLTASRVTGGTLGAAEAPALTVTRDGETLRLALDVAPGQLDTGAAIALLDGFAARLEQPLRQLF